MKRILSLGLLLLMIAMTGTAQIVKGDMNDDGVLNITDVTSSVNVILGKQAQEGVNVFNALKGLKLTFTKEDESTVVGIGNLLKSVTGNTHFVKGDMNNDGVLNITDVTSSVNVILGKQAQEEMSVADLLKGLELTFTTEDESTVVANGNQLTSISIYHEYVDLGLPSGTKWATKNVGASKPEEYGDYFAWSKIESYLNNHHNGPRKDYGIDSLEYGGDLGGGGWGENQTELTPAQDAASMNWGEEWRIPSKVQFDELKNYCTWTWTTMNGVSGYQIVGVNGNSIFLPSAGYRSETSLYDTNTNGKYWSRSIDTNNKNLAWYMNFNGDEILIDGYSHNYGLSIRPVRSNTVAHEYVDLGLTSGTLWATANVGASFPEDYGDYFSWGETDGFNSGKKKYTWSTYKYCKGSNKTMTKYCNKNEYGYEGYTDALTELELSDDAAYTNWGSNWRTPSDEQWTELRTECTWTWTKQNEVNGYLVTSKANGKTIFLPAAGYHYNSSHYDGGNADYYWSRTVNPDNPGNAYGIYFNNRNVYRDSYIRYNGQSVRPVRLK